MDSNTSARCIPYYKFKAVTCHINNGVNKLKNPTNANDDITEEIIVKVEELSPEQKNMNSNDIFLSVHPTASINELNDADVKITAHDDDFEDIKLTEVPLIKQNFILSYENAEIFNNIKSEEPSTSSNVDHCVLNKSYICGYCNQEFAKKMCLEKHITKYNNLQQGMEFYIEENNALRGNGYRRKQSFSDRNILNRHMRTHTEDNTFAATECIEIVDSDEEYLEEEYLEDELEDSPAEAQAVPQPASPPHPSPSENPSASTSRAEPGDVDMDEWLEQTNNPEDMEPTTTPEICNSKKPSSRASPDQLPSDVDSEDDNISEQEAEDVTIVKSSRKRPLHPSSPLRSPSLSGKKLSSTTTRAQRPQSASPPHPSQLANPLASTSLAEPGNVHMENGLEQTSDPKDMEPTTTPEICNSKKPFPRASPDQLPDEAGSDRSVGYAPSDVDSEDDDISKQEAEDVTIVKSSRKRPLHPSSKVKGTGQSSARGSWARRARGKWQPLAREARGNLGREVGGSSCGAASSSDSNEYRERHSCPSRAVEGKSGWQPGDIVLEICNSKKPFPRASPDQPDEAGSDRSVGYAPSDVDSEDDDISEQEAEDVTIVKSSRKRPLHPSSKVKGTGQSSARGSWARRARGKWQPLARGARGNLRREVGGSSCGAASSSDSNEYRERHSCPSRAVEGKSGWQPGDIVLEICNSKKPFPRASPDQLPDEAGSDRSVGYAPSDVDSGDDDISKQVAEDVTIVKSSRKWPLHPSSKVKGTGQSSARGSWARRARGKWQPLARGARGNLGREVDGSSCGAASSSDSNEYRERHSCPSRAVEGKSGWQPGDIVLEVYVGDKDIPDSLREMVLRNESARRERNMRGRQQDVGMNADDREEDEFRDAESFDQELFAGDEEAMEFTWSTMATFRGRAEKFLVENPGPTVTVSGSYEAFRIYWDDGILEHIVRETNRYAAELMSSSVRFAKDWYDTNLHELMILFAFWMMLGNIQMPSIKSCFSDNPLLKTDIFRSLMTEARYWHLTRALHFVDNATRTRASSKLFSLGPLVEHLNTKFQQAYVMNQMIKIEQSLTLREGNESFRRCIRTKAATHTIKTFEICESSSGYLWSFAVYACKDISSEKCRMPNRTEIVTRLMRPLLNKGYQLHLNSWFSSPVLARFLKRNKTDCVGTLRPTQESVPALIQLVTVDNGTCVARHSGDVVVMASQTELVPMYTISTCHGTESYLGRRKSGKFAFIPAVVAHVNRYASLVVADKKDYMPEPFLIERKKSWKWYNMMFKRLLNASVANSRIVLEKFSNDHNSESEPYPLSLVNEILARHLQQVPQPHLRPAATSAQFARLPPDRLVGQHFIARATPGNDSRILRRCFWCTVVEKRYQTTEYYCETCQVPLCFEGCFKSYHI